MGEGGGQQERKRMGWKRTNGEGKVEGVAVCNLCIVLSWQ